MELNLLKRHRKGSVSAASFIGRAKFHLLQSPTASRVQVYPRFDPKKSCIILYPGLDSSSILFSCWARPRPDLTHRRSRIDLPLRPTPLLLRVLFTARYLQVPNLPSLKPLRHVSQIHWFGHKPKPNSRTAIVPHSIHSSTWSLPWGSSCRCGHRWRPQHFLPAAKRTSLKVGRNRR